MPTDQLNVTYQPKTLLVVVMWSYFVSIDAVPMCSDHFHLSCRPFFDSFFVHALTFTIMISFLFYLLTQFYLHLIMYYPQCDKINCDRELLSHVLYVSITVVGNGLIKYSNCYGYG